MKRIVITLFLLIGLLHISASNENIVIENYSDVFRVIPLKDGSGIKEIKNSVKIDYRTRRTAGTAHAVAFYNDCISIDKAAGGKTEYGMTEEEDVFFSDSKVCVMTLPMKKAGDKATARFERTFKDPKYFSRTALSAQYDVENYTVSFIIPTSLVGRLKVVDRRMPDGFTRTVENRGNETVVTYNVKNLLSAEKVSRRVPTSLTVPTVYLLGEFDDYNDLYRYLHSLTRLNDDADAQKVADLAREITRDCLTDSAKIAAIYDYVHDNIRYIAVEHGIYSHMPDLPSEVLRKRFGDCKGSAGLLRAMLRGAGIDGRFVWIGTKDIPTDWTEFPVLASGNHMIAAAVTGDSILYLDGTATYNPMGVIPAFIRGRQTLVEDTDRTCIVGRVPDMPVETDSYRIKVDMKPAADGSTDVSAAYSEIMTGAYSNRLQASLDFTIESKRNDLVTDYLASMVKGSRAEVKSVERTRGESKIEADMTIPNVVRTIGSDMYVNLSPFISLGALEIDTKDRPAVDAMLRTPAAASVITEFSIPDGYAVASIPAAEEVTNKWFTATLEPVSSPDGRKVGMHFDLRLMDSYIPAADVDAFVADVRRLRRAVNNQIQLSKIE